MRFVRSTSANNANENEKHPRNCIATAKIKADKILKSKSSFLKAVKDLFVILKEKACSFFSNVDKKVWTFCSTVLFLTALITFFNLNFCFGYNVFFNGENLGYALSKDDVESYINEINSEFSEYVSGQDLIDGSIAYIPSVILKENLTGENQFKENIKATSFVMEKAFAVEIDGKAYVALQDEKSAHDALNVILNSYKFSQDTETSFEEKVDILHEYVPSSIILSFDQAIGRLLSYTTVLKSVSPSLTMTLGDFALENGLSEEVIRELNPKINNYVSGKDEIIIPLRKPILTVISKEIVTYENKLAFEQEVVKDASVYEGTEKIVRQGKDGVSEIKEQVIYLNGRKSATTLLSNDIKQEPVTQKVCVGTKKRPDNMGTGTFLRPYYGQISSRFGYRRSGNHTGVDFCGNAGDPILASDNGTVIFSGWSGGYGYVVKIDHNNGYVTYYAHCSSLLVDVGETVKKGQTIATVGSTGNSTGPHVHFEVHYNGKVQNPMNFVG